jgi:hypothetical protein
LNRASPRRGGVRNDDGGPIEAVKTSQAGGDRMFMDAVAAERTHLRCPRVGARHETGDESRSGPTRCHGGCWRGAHRGRAAARSAVRRGAWAPRSEDTATCPSAWRRQTELRMVVPGRPVRPRDTSPGRGCGTGARVHRSSGYGRNASAGRANGVFARVVDGMPPYAAPSSRRHSALSGATLHWQKATKGANETARGRIPRSP